MQFPEEDSPVLKEWIVKRLENTSDADADVLADYVLALLHNANDDTNVQEVFDAEITPFLREDTKVFTNDLIQTIKHRSYPYFPTGPAASGRKRGFQDRGDYDAPDGREQFMGGGRSFKQPRRGGGRRGYVDPDRPQPVQELQYGYPSAPGLNANAPAFAPGGPVLDMSGFNPNGDPMEAMRKLQELQQQIGLQMASFPNFPQQQNYPSQRQQPQRRRGRCRDYDNKGYCARGHNCMYEHSNETEAMFNNLPAPQISGQIQLPVGGNETSRAQSVNTFVPQPGFSDPASPQVDMYKTGSPKHRRDNRHGQQKRSGPKRAPFSFLGPMHDRTQTKLVVECIPEENFEEKQIRDFFSQFGNIEEVTMMAYKRLAIVKFDTWHSANEAYNSPNVIFNNRFVKLFWYKDEKHAELGNGGGTNGAEKETSATNGSRISADAQEPEIDMEEFKRQQETAQKAHEEKMRIKKELAEKQAELDRKRKELQAKQEAEKQKLAKLAAAKKESLPPGDEDMGEKEEGAKPSKPSSQTEALRATLAKLQEEAKSIGLDPHVNSEEDATISTYADYSPYPSYSPYPPRGGRGGYSRGGRGGYVPRGSYRGRGGTPGRGNIHAAYAAFSLDNRPKKVALTGVDFSAPEKDEALRQHLFSMGELSAEIQVTPAKTHVGFSDRKAAENFFNTIAAALPGDKIEVAWIANTAGPLPGSATSKIEATGGTERNGGAVEEEGVDATMADTDAKHNGGQVQLEGVEEDYDVAGDNEWDIA
ncbi:hypothetical protein N0V93_004389 [Gnomoniopsis smithogilvyi]|uniref:RNA-binding protein n=1 Tax=Gnomoniopsis smithogilvyi TaxID=1191159 RepID=A0A9W8YR01_9PEZI|nr:hypothetical protein N0V93_004389 [Gnomoniopsis smithogilvyi]